MTSTSLTEFAEEVIGTANALDGSRGSFPGRAWIHRVWTFSFYRRMDYADFQDQLWSAHKAGLVTLASCDMVEAFRDTDVRRARLEGPDGGVFHFIRTA